MTETTGESYETTTRAGEAALLLATGLISLLLACLVLHVWKYHLHVPIEYYGDGLQHITMVRTVIDHGWVLTNPNLGYPGEMNLRAFPAYDNLAVLIIRLLAFAIHDAGLLINLFFFLTFPLIAMSACYAARQLGVSRTSSLVIGVLYSMLPYHFRRSIGHLFLSCYYLVPLLLLLAMRLATTGSVVLKTAEERTERDWIFPLLVAVTLGLNGAYYPYFSVFVVFAAMVIGYGLHRQGRTLREGTLLIAVIGGLFVASYLPAVLYGHAHPEQSAATRAPGESETFGLKVAQLVLPITDHRISPFSRIKEQYNSSYPLVNENDDATLGLIGTIGFIALLVNAARFWRKERNLQRDVSSALTIAILAFGTIGGVAALISLFFFSQIRAYNRLSVFIAFLALVTAGELYDRATRHWKTASRIALAGMLLLFGGYDQTSRHFAHFQPKPGEFPKEPTFAQSVAAQLGNRGAIFQLPYVPFPEGGQRYEMADYELFRPYLETHGLRWSYGAVRNSRGDAWQIDLLQKPLAEQIETLVLAGFSGIFIDRWGYSDHAALLERQLHDILLTAPQASSDQRYSFFSLSQERWLLQQRLGEAWKDEVIRAATPPLVFWGGGFTGLERDGADTWHWGSRDGALIVENDRNTPIVLDISMHANTGYDEKASLKIRGALWSQDLAISRSGVTLARRLVVPPGRNVIHFECNARRIISRGDPRVLVLRVSQFELHEVEPQAQPLRRAM